MNKFLPIKISIALLVMFFVFANNGQAQSAPEFLITWRAKNFVPANYQGKIFPINNSFLEAGFDLIDNGKIIDLSKTQIRWYLDGRFVKAGNGLKSLSFNASAGNNSSHSLRINIPNYKTNELDSVFSIPTVSPSVIIDRPVANPDAVSIGGNSFQAIPYFFNAANQNDLDFQWTINGQKPEGQNAKADILKLNLTSQGTPFQNYLNITVSVQNILNKLEIASQSINPLIQ